MQDPFHLSRFIEAQASLYPRVLRELSLGEKRTHWMWFVFPQIAGLGSSAMAREYAIGSRAEAEAYLAHPVLGPRLLECAQVVNAIENRTIDEIFGYPDDMKFRSSMTLFHEVTPQRPEFTAALVKYFDGDRDTATLTRLK